jgi:hypothetical protein
LTQEFSQQIRQPADFLLEAALKSFFGTASDGEEVMHEYPKGLPTNRASG